MCVQVHAAKDAPLKWDEVVPVVPEMAAGVLPMLLEEERARDTYAAANGIQNLAALLPSNSLWVRMAHKHRDSNETRGLG